MAGWSTRWNSSLHQQGYNGSYKRIDEKHPAVSMILATGGSAMVKAAYSSGKPALGVGPGNVPAYIERSADIKKAVRNIINQ